MLRPATETELAELVRGAVSPFEIMGAGTKRNLGRPIAVTPLDLSRFSKVIAYEPEELILEAGAAAKLSDIEKLLAKKNQMLAFEPPDFSKLLGSEHSGTLGGLLNCNHAGARRVRAGAARDHILGLSGVNGKGEIFKAGARVVKNVTGYDLPRLIAGSYGTLAALTSVIFKVLPKPETEITLRVSCKSPEHAVRVMAQAMQSNCEISSAAYLPQEGVYLRLEGIEASVNYRRDALQKFVMGSDYLAQDKSVALWQGVRDAAPFWKFKTHNIWRISVPPMDAPRVIAEWQKQFPFAYYLDWAGGLIWLAHEPNVETVTKLRGAITQGHATLFRANAETRARVEVFQPQAPELAALSARVKAAFDPRALFNPGRMYRNI